MAVKVTIPFHDNNTTACDTMLKNPMSTFTSTDLSTFLSEFVF
jgi:hypothetical protein